MKKAPYSLQEAQEICKGFQHLTGSCFTSGGQATIQCVAVAPCDQYNKERFIMYYLLLNDAEVALKEEYDGLHYDVIIIGCTQDGSLVNESIYTWLLKNNYTPVSPDMDIISGNTKANTVLRK